MPSARGEAFNTRPKGLASDCCRCISGQRSARPELLGAVAPDHRCFPRARVCALSSRVLAGRGGCGAVRRRWLLARPAPFWLLLELRSSEELTLPEELRLPVKPLQALGEPGVPGREASLDACRA